MVSALSLAAVAGFQGKLNLLTSTFARRPLYYLMLGLINPLIYYLVLFKAYDLLPASLAQPLNYSWAITLTLMAALFLGQKIRKQDWIAAALGYAGVVVIATKGDLLGLEFDSPLGVGLALLSTVVGGILDPECKKPSRPSDRSVAWFSVIAALFHWP